MSFVFSNTNVQCIVTLYLYNNNDYYNYYYIYNYVAHFAYTCNNLSKHINKVAKCNNMWLVNKISLILTFF